MTGRYDSATLDTLAENAKRDSYVVLKDHLPKDTLRAWADAFQPLLKNHMEREGHLQNRGSGRFYVTLPFDTPFADPAIFEDDDILGIVERLVGREPVMCQLATDTPIRGSDFQEIHRDTPSLFPELSYETPMYQLAVNFPLCDVTPENGPIEIAKGTHMMPRDEALAKVDSGEIPLEQVCMKLGDVMIRDVRHLHRGTPNTTDTPRPMVVIGYSRRWLFRPEVSIKVPRAVHERLSDRARHLLRFNQVVESLDQVEQGEKYQAFAF
ncbi:phytanoyl-CoA dioxygenase family protein (plasmid) [Skermanella rosea]|uniref:phytanoyl-CoA dioxygenase family protein n=1 Tax=Skermanella rosea TaxID=1817965 RepID=UPI001933D338|nr:phytanoyl-CoA dioxygenase family protein [Skermanella rosea]UEM07959.1 phytanoyl-CoA dioxygenase family protein [Skermanella rosea]